MNKLKAKTKLIKLRPFKIRYDRQTKMYVAQDLDVGIASQGETRNKAYDNLIEALRLVCLTYQDVYSGRRKK